MLKKYNTPTGKTVDRVVNNTTINFIASVTCFTPADDARLDKLIGVGTKDGHGEPDPIILEQLNGLPENKDWFNALV